MRHTRRALHSAYEQRVPLYRGIFRVFVSANNFLSQQHDVDIYIYMMKYNAIEVVIMILLISRAFDIVRTFRIDRDAMSLLQRVWDLRNIYHLAELELTVRHLLIQEWKIFY